jgi:hypothetical protein
MINGLIVSWKLGCYINNNIKLVWSKFIQYYFFQNFFNNNNNDNCYYIVFQFSSILNINTFNCNKDNNI